MCLSISVREKVAEEFLLRNKSGDYNRTEIGCNQILPLCHVAHLQESYWPAHRAEHL